MTLRAADVDNVAQAGAGVAIKGGDGRPASPGDPGYGTASGAGGSVTVSGGSGAGMDIHGGVGPAGSAVMTGGSAVDGAGGAGVLQGGATVNGTGGAGKIVPLLSSRTMFCGYSRMCFLILSLYVLYSQGRL